MLVRSTRKIIVVNDDLALRASMASFLGANEYEVSKATDGYVALWQLKHGPVSQIISDLRNPGIGVPVSHSPPIPQFMASAYKAESQKRWHHPGLPELYDAGKKFILSTQREVFEFCRQRANGWAVRESHTRRNHRRSLMEYQGAKGLAVGYPEHSSDLRLAR
jgi:hypothetical protein